MNKPHIQQIKSLITPADIKAEWPLSLETEAYVQQIRQAIENILKRQDDRLLVVVGPCSVHDENSALEYGQRLAQQMMRFKDTLCLVMRVYFQKPRTVLGWKGFIHDPHLDESFDIETGLCAARRLLLALNQLNLACASEFLDVIIPQYIVDLIAWSAIGARTTESQIHRQLASGLPTPTGFKNSQSGDIQVAVNAVYTAQYPQQFLSIGEDGKAAMISTTGNPWCHIILRGGHGGPNYAAPFVLNAAQQLQSKCLAGNIMIDCAHGNSGKDHLQQLSVAFNVSKQIASGNSDIIGIMLESHLIAGKQKLTGKKSLIYGQSITDPCLGWEETVKILESLSLAVKKRRDNVQKESLKYEYA